MNLFHLAITVSDLKETTLFYTTLFDVRVGREAENWIDFDFFGHQLSAHLNPGEDYKVKANEVDGKLVPVKHFGIIMDWDEWHNLADKLKKNSTSFIIEPYIRFEGKVGEQATMFLSDPSDNVLEFKSFKDKNKIFSTQ